MYNDEIDNELGIVELLKERAGLKLHCAEYKRKYKALNRILRRELFYVIEGLKTRRRTLVFRLSRESDHTQRELINSALEQTSSMLKNLERIYELCEEATK